MVALRVAQVRRGVHGVRIVMPERVGVRSRWVVEVCGPWHKDERVLLRCGGLCVESQDLGEGRS